MPSSYHSDGRKFRTCWRQESAISSEPEPHATRVIRSQKPSWETRCGRSCLRPEIGRRVTGLGSILESIAVRIAARLAFAGVMLVQVFCLATGLEAWTSLTAPLAFAASGVVFVAPVAASLVAATSAITSFDWHWCVAAAMPTVTVIGLSSIRMQNGIDLNASG